MTISAGLAYLIARIRTYDEMHRETGQDPLGRYSAPIKDEAA